MNDAGVPAGEVFTVPEALAHPQIADRGMIGAFDNVPGVDRDIQIARPGIKLDGAAVRTDDAPPVLGEHTSELLDELGFSAQEIAALREEKAV